MTTTATRTARRTTAFRSQQQIAALVGKIARHNLADGTAVRARIDADTTGGYLMATIVDGELEGRRVRLNRFTAVEG